MVKNKSHLGNIPKVEKILKRKKKKETPFNYMRWEVVYGKTKIDK